ncbi:DNA replication and repair protein RecN [Alteromonadaceae bacterium Bs31]|nr:DNA replication and repair protein RecN [Alteromonadaceae bacterium Bs31]
MLTHLHISDFTLVDRLDLELENGLTTITGETGAGKSVMLDALALALGDRTDAEKVRAGCNKADIHASFDISQHKHAQKWLEQHELNEGEECILRRVVTSEGRSRAFINGQTVTLSQLRALGEMLIDIHRQHEHQSLLNSKTHQRLLDAFGGLKPLAKQVKQAFHQWHAIHFRLNGIKNQNEELNARFQLLSYQVEELDKLALEQDELGKLEQEQRVLANVETLNTHCAQINALCSNEQGLEDQLRQAVQLLSCLQDKPATLNEAESLLNNAHIYVQEAQAEVGRYMDNQEQDGARLAEVEQRLSAIYEIAQKHRIAPEELERLHHDLSSELSELQSGDEQIETLESQLAEAFTHYQQLALELSKQREFACARLSKAVNRKLAQLDMSHAKLSIALNKTTKGEPSDSGNEHVELMISTNPGQPAKPLIKIASGGELSRVSLAIQVVTAQSTTTPTLVFDEVDVGIGGTTGDEVGRLLRELGKNAQVFCVTHLAQVACKGHQHMHVSKSVSKKASNSKVQVLDEHAKVLEIARMMGGSVESESSLAHAREMLAASA